MGLRAAVAVLALLVCGGLGPAPVTPDPGLRYAVAGRGPLILRVGPEPDSAVAATFPSGAAGLILTGRSVPGEDGPSWEILPPGAEGRPAWAPASRLIAREPDSAPAPLQCAGTEPFWGLRLEGGEARMNRPGAMDEIFRAGRRQGAVGDPGVFVQRLAAQGRTSGQVVVIRRPEGCSDGMSDLSSPYETVLTMPSGEVLAGCCRRAGG